MARDDQQPWKVTALVLAAGRSSRFEGGHKLLADAGGVPLVRRVLDATAASTVDDIILVVGSQGDAILSAAGQGRWRAVSNADAGQGLSTSIRAGLAAAGPETTGALIVLADMPGITSRLIDRVIAAARQNPSAIVHPIAPSGSQGHPVYWPSDLFAGLNTLRGDTGAKPLLTANASRILAIDAGGDDAVSDIDTASDLETFRRNMTRG